MRSSTWRQILDAIVSHGKSREREVEKSERVISTDMELEKEDLKKMNEREELNLLQKFLKNNYLRTSHVEFF